MSLGAKLTNIFVAPGDVFDDLRCHVPVWQNWATPLAFLAGLVIVYTFVVFSQPAILQTVRDAQEKTEATVRQQVAAGRLSQAQADQQIRFMELFSGPAILKAAGIFRAFIGTPIVFLIEALVVWLVGKFALGGAMDFGRALEITGLPLMISALSLLVAMLLAVIYGNLAASASPALLVSHFNQQNPVHVGLAMLNVFAIWRLAVISLGLGRVTGATVAKAAAWIFGIWVAFNGFILGGVILLAKLRPPQ